MGRARIPGSYFPPGIPGSDREYRSFRLEAIAPGGSAAVKRIYVVLPFSCSTDFRNGATDATLRAQGVRTRKEINGERCAVKALRGDFAKASPDITQPE